MGIKQKLNAAKEQAKGQVKKAIKKILIKVAPYICGLVLIAGSFFVIEGVIKDTADKVVNAAAKVASIFDNKSEKPVVVISDDLIKEVKAEMQEQGMELDETYVTDALIKASLEAYYATQYPYIDGVDYGDTDSNEETTNVVKGCIYLKRDDEEMTYITYDDFKDKLGSAKSTTDRDKVKNSFSVDDEGNIVIATWSMSNKVTETINADGKYDQEGSTTSISYDITEYKIDQKTLAEQYTMSYKLPILLANMYSNEGFGLAVANLGKNSKIELTVLDSTTETTTVSKEYMNINYKTSGTYSWRDMEDDPLKTEKFQDITWVETHTDEKNAYKITTEDTETNQITIKPTEIDTWTVKGKVSEIKANKGKRKAEDPSTTEMENDDDYKEDPSQKVSDETIETIKSTIVNNREEGSGPMTENSIESVDAKVYKKITDHKKTTETSTKETSYTAADMELKDNTDKFLALIKADKDGNFDKDGKLVKYLKKGVKVTNTDSAVNWVSNSSSLGGKYIVKTDESGALPTLTKKQLKKACDTLPSDQKKNALDFIDAVKDAEDKYKVNAVFSLAVFRKENGIATNKKGILGKNTFNIGSITGKYNGKYITVTHKDGTKQNFKKYPSYDEAIVDYAKNIAEGKYYFKVGKYDVDEIGSVYCVPPDNWIKVVKEYIDDFYESAGVSIDSITAAGEVAQGGKGTLGTYTSKKGKVYNLYLQGGDAPWADNDYGNDRKMSKAGCGPTAEAIIASAYDGKITPETTRADIIKHNGTGNHSNSLYISGSLKRLLPQVKVTNASWNNEKVKKCLKSGGQVWAVVKKCNYTSGSHCIALIDYQNRHGDKVYVAHGTASSRPYGWDDLNYIKNNLKYDGVVYVGGD